MSAFLSQKLKIKKGFTLIAVNAPADFQKTLSPLPAAVKILASAHNYNQVHWFVMNKAQMEEN